MWTELFKEESWHHRPESDIVNVAMFFKMGYSLKSYEIDI